MRKTVLKLFMAGAFFCMIFSGCTQNKENEFSWNDLFEEEESLKAGENGEDDPNAQNKTDDQKESENQGEIDQEDENQGEMDREENGTETGKEIQGGQKITEIYVQVAGAVNNPGVYKLPEGSRVYEAVDLAGGLTEDGAYAAVNMVEFLRDGQKIVIPTLKEVEEGFDYNSSDAQDSKNTNTEAEKSTMVNINTAGKEELCTLPGIGESKADAILLYRKENGSFHNIEEICNVSGIKESAFQKIKDKITVSD